MLEQQVDQDKTTPLFCHRNFLISLRHTSVYIFSKDYTEQSKVNLDRSSLYAFLSVSFHFSLCACLIHYRLTLCLISIKAKGFQCSLLFHHLVLLFFMQIKNPSDTDVCPISFPIPNPSPSPFASSAYILSFSRSSCELSLYHLALPIGVGGALPVLLFFLDVKA